MGRSWGWDSAVALAIEQIFSLYFIFVYLRSMNRSICYFLFNVFFKHLCSKYILLCRGESVCLLNPYAVTVNPFIGYIFEIRELNTLLVFWEVTCNQLTMWLNFPVVRYKQMKGLESAPTVYCDIHRSYNIIPRILENCIQKGPQNSLTHFSGKQSPYKYHLKEGFIVGIRPYPNVGGREEVTVQRGVGKSMKRSLTGPLKTLM